MQPPHQSPSDNNTAETAEKKITYPPHEALLVHQHFNPLPCFYTLKDLVALSLSPYPPPRTKSPNPQLSPWRVFCQDPGQDFIPWDRDFLRQFRKGSYSHILNAAV